MSTMSDKELRDLRDELVAKITQEDFVWKTIRVKGTITGGPQDVEVEVNLQVSQPVMIDGYYVPVTANETKRFCRNWGWLPLTRAVADQAHNQAEQHERDYTQTSLTDFDRYSGYLTKLYGKDRDAQKSKNIVSGAHKLWVMSSRGGSINYGFYLPRKKSKAGAYTDPQRGGPTLEPQTTVIQSLGARHDGAHWDYSQLLQLMKRDKPLAIAGQSYSLAMAVRAGLAPFWDETPGPTIDAFPW
jgi:hypothetical protein